MSLLNINRSSEFSTGLTDKSSLYTDQLGDMLVSRVNPIDEARHFVVVSTSWFVFEIRFFVYIYNKVLLLHIRYISGVNNN